MNWCNTAQDEIYWWKDMLQQNVSHFKFELISANTIIPIGHHVRMANIGLTMNTQIPRHDILQ